MPSSMRFRGDELPAVSQDPASEPSGVPTHVSGIAMQVAYADSAGLPAIPGEAGEAPCDRLCAGLLSAAATLPVRRCAAFRCDGADIAGEGSVRDPA